MELVVARYKEDLSWLKEVPSDIKIIVYNKGDPIHNIKHIQRPNVGREGETYAHHIISRYDSLPEVTIFTQGNPFDHSPKFLDFLRFFDRSKQPSIPFQFVSSYKLTTTFKECPYHKEIPMKFVSDQLFGLRDDQEFAFCPGAIFVVSKTAILSRPIDTYIYIKYLLEYANNPVEGYVIERLWNIIFDPDSASKGSLVDMASLPRIVREKPKRSLKVENVETSSSHTLSAGEIVAIVLACVAIVYCILVFLFKFQTGCNNKREKFQNKI